MSGLTNEQLYKALAYSDDGGGVPFELVPAKGGRPALVVDLFPVLSGDYVRCCVRRIKGERERWLAQNRDSIREARREAREAGREKSDAEIEAEVDAKVEAELMAHVERQIDSGHESMAAFVACSMRKPADERLEALLMRNPRLPAAHAEADRLTHANPDEDFSEGVNAWIWGPKTPRTSEPSGTDGQTDGTTTLPTTDPTAN